ncbi:hypothetical protein GCM10025774_13050 [Microbacterium kyungheense]|uniref:DUF7882 domain-containing protein n=2 Tax=Microbacterium kyungheense TaxID=1263636 RepID=A0A543F135_9MICO|nr:hypothetical protein FB391_1557 [Microbacterium kyungheense]
MGHLIYGVAPAIDIEDRALEHLRVVIVTKLRRDESFSFNWDNEPDVSGDDAINAPGLHGTVWISKASSLYFSFDSAPTAALNPHWIMALMEEANSNRGLRLVPEPERP